MSAPSKTCPDCNADKLLTPEFWQRRGKGSHKLQKTRCKVCYNKNQKDTAWKANWAGFKDSDGSKFTPDKYKSMFARQNHRCAICSRTPADVGGKDRQFHLDHDKTTMVVRGILCGGCNPGIGFLGHSPTRLRAAAEYCEKSTAATKEQGSSA